MGICGFKAGVHNVDSTIIVPKEEAYKNSKEEENKREAGKEEEQRLKDKNKPKPIQNDDIDNTKKLDPHSIINEDKLANDAKDLKQKPVNSNSHISEDDRSEVMLIK